MYTVSGTKDILHFFNTEDSVKLLVYYLLFISYNGDTGVIKIHYFTYELHCKLIWTVNYKAQL